MNGDLWDALRQDHVRHIARLFGGSHGAAAINRQRSQLQLPGRQRLSDLPRAPSPSSSCVSRKATAQAGLPVAANPTVWHNINWWSGTSPIALDKASRSNQARMTVDNPADAQ